ncbi:hypothetical protein J1N35_041596, partial [Gossypium stocksii]
SFYTTTSVPTILLTNAIDISNDDNFDVDYICGTNEKSIFSTIIIWDTIYLYVDGVTNTLGIIVLP